MKVDSKLRVVSLEKLGGGIFIQFSNGEAALYSAALLHSVIGDAFVLHRVAVGSGQKPHLKRIPEASAKPN